MQGIAWLDLVLIGLLCCAVSAVAVTWLTPRRAPPDSWINNPARGYDQVLLFDGPHLIEASSEARSAFQTDEDGFDWARLHSALDYRFPGFPANPDIVHHNKLMTIPARGNGDQEQITCEWIDGITRVNLFDSQPNEPCAPAAMKELTTLRDSAENAPNPAWRVESDGRISWSNPAYNTLRDQVVDDKAGPPGAVFPSVSTKRQIGKKTRTSVAINGNNRKSWYDITVAKQGSGLLCYAVDINAVVDAEQAQRNFVQTLAKTFAHLPIGLAIFDRNRQLALFNPALIDLTTLPADFLSARPNLFSFFDRLRDQRMMPEPKSYSSWRQQMADLVAAAADGRYQETWTLPSGAVYSVTGRPHPDGAVAFLIEDITAEITLTRRFRTDLEINQSMLDQMDDAIAVFSGNGTLGFVNRAYRELWRVDPESSFVQMTVIDATKTWQDLCKPTPALGEVRDFVGLHENRSEWWDEVQLLTGRVMTCGVFPISHGATMVVFGSGHANNTVRNTPTPTPRVDQMSKS